MVTDMCGCCPRSEKSRGGEWLHAERRQDTWKIGNWLVGCRDATQRRQVIEKSARRSVGRVYGTKKSLKTHNR